MQGKSLEYKSCMKIDGVPILPPLMTKTKKKEMEYYKHLAIAVQDRLKLLKETSNSEQSDCSNTVINNEDLYNCGDVRYKLVFADPQPQLTEEHCIPTNDSNSDTDTNLVTTTSCPNQASSCIENADSDSNLDVRNFASAPTLVRSNSYTLEQPGPLLQAQLDQLGVYGTVNNVETQRSSRQLDNNIRGSGRRKTGMKRKLPMKYSVFTNYNGFTSPIIIDEAITQTVNKKSPDLLYISKRSARRHRRRKNMKKFYNTTANTKMILLPESKSIDQDSISQNETLTKETSFASLAEQVASTHSKEDVISVGPCVLNDVNMPATTRKSMQNLFETIQGNHAKQMQRLMEQQKADQEVLKQAFERQQAAIMREIHRSYSLSRIRSDTLEVAKADQEIPELQQTESASAVCSVEEKPFCDFDCTTDFMKTSEILLIESSELLKRASSSIDSYLESRCPSAKLSQDCMSSVTSSVIILSPKRDVNEGEETNTTMDISVYYTPTDTPSKNVYDYNKSVECFGNLKIEDVVQEPEKQEDSQSKCNTASLTAISVESKVARSSSNSSSGQGFNRELFPEIVNSGYIVSDLEIQERAATVLCAAARSYLVRRLLRTQRVCSIKRAIRETLLCALKLHGDGGIRTSDADLHRRLIQQLNAACHELHDIFFKTSTDERMRMISRDREIVIGPYRSSGDGRYYRAGSKSSDNGPLDKYPVDCGKHLRHTSSKSLDKQADDHYGDLSPRKDIRRCMSYSITRKPWR